jgi:hypothetical protein
MPKLWCTWAGASTIPGTFVLMNAGCPPGVVIHEMGHNYGLHHSDLIVPDG